MPSTLGVDAVLILLSYVPILKTVLSIASNAERLQASNTCVSRRCAVLLFYTPHQPSHDPPLWEKEAASSDIHASLLPALSGTSNAQPRGLQHQNQRDSRPGSEDAPPPKALSYGG